MTVFKIKSSHPTPRPLREMYGPNQATPWFWIMDEEGNPITRHVRCKDYLHDFFASVILKKPVLCHGFEWKPEWGTDSADKDRFTIGMINPNATGWTPDLKNTSAVFSLIEKKLKVTHPCVVREITVTRSRKECVGMAVTLDRVWYSKPWLVSLATLLMRTAPAYKGGDLDDFLKALKNLDFSVKGVSVSDAMGLSRQGELLIEYLDGRLVVDNEYSKYEEGDNVSASIHNGGGFLNTFQTIQYARDRSRF